MTTVNRMPPGTKLERRIVGKHRTFSWRGIIETPANEENIGPINNPDLGTVCDHLLILYRRKQNEDN